MSTRQAFIPQRSQSAVNMTASSEPHPSPSINAPKPLNLSASKNFDHPRTSLDADPRDTLRNAGGKARSLAAFLGRKKGTLSPVAQADGPEPAEGQMQLHRRSFDGIRRPDMTPLSIIPYPTPQPHATGQGTYTFPRPSTPLSAPGILKKGLGGHEGGCDNEDEDGILFMGPGAETESRVDTGGGVTGYMRIFSRSGSGGTGMGTGRIGQQTLGLKIVAPVPGYTHAGLGIRTGVKGDDEGQVDRMYAHQSRSLGAIPEEVGHDEVERITKPERSLRRVKRGIGREDMERDGRSIGEDDQSQGSAKRLRRTQDEDEEYTRLSSPHIPPTPAFPATALHDLADPSLTLDSLFENIGEFVNVEEFEAECKRWTECTREEWLKGANELIEEYTEVLNMVKDHLTEKVMSFANLTNAVGERRAELNRDNETLHEGMGIVTENISKLAKRKW